MWQDVTESELRMFEMGKNGHPPSKSLASGHDYGLRVAWLYMPLQVSVSWCHVRTMNVTASHAYRSWVMFEFPLSAKGEKNWNSLEILPIDAWTNRWEAIVSWSTHQQCNHDDKRKAILWMESPKVIDNVSRLENEELCGWRKHDLGLFHQRIL